MLLSKNLSNKIKGKSIRVNKNGDLVFFVNNLRVVNCIFELEDFKPTICKFELDIPSNDYIIEIIPYKETQLIVLTKFCLYFVLEFEEDELVMIHYKEDLKEKKNEKLGHSLALSKFTSADISEDSKQLAITNFSNGINRVVIFEIFNNTQLRFLCQESSEPDITSTSKFFSYSGHFSSLCFKGTYKGHKILLGYKFHGKRDIYIFLLVGKKLILFQIFEDVHICNFGFIKMMLQKAFLMVILIGLQL